MDLKGFVSLASCGVASPGSDLRGSNRYEIKRNEESHYEANFLFLQTLDGGQNSLIN